MFPILSGNVASATAVSGNQEGIFGFGFNGSNYLSMTNLVSNAGVISTDVSGVGTNRQNLAGCQYGADKGIFAYGAAVVSDTTTHYGMSNLVSNAGVVGSDVSAVGQIRPALAACSYGEDKGIFGYGESFDSPFQFGMTNLVSNVGVVSTDVTGVGTARQQLAACEYGDDKGIFGYGDKGR